MVQKNESFFCEISKSGKFLRLSLVLLNIPKQPELKQSRFLNLTFSTVLRFVKTLEDTEFTKKYELYFFEFF